MSLLHLRHHRLVELEEENEFHLRGVRPKGELAESLWEIEVFNGSGNMEKMDD